MSKWVENFEPIEIAPESIAEGARLILEQSGQLEPHTIRVGNVLYTASEYERILERLRAEAEGDGIILPEPNRPKSDVDLDRVVCRRRPPDISTA